MLRCEYRQGGGRERWGLAGRGVWHAVQVIPINSLTHQKFVNRKEARYDLHKGNMGYYIVIYIHAN